MFDIEVPIGNAARQTRHVELNAKMHGQTDRQIVESIVNRKLAAFVPIECHDLGDLHRVRTQTALSSHAGFDSVTRAANDRLISARVKIADQAGARLELRQRQTGLQEVIDQCLLRVRIVEDLLVEILLLAFDLALNARRVDALRVAIGRLDNRFVVDLGTTVQRGQQIVFDRTNVEFVKVATRGRAEKRHESIAANADFFASV